MGALKKRGLNHISIHRSTTYYYRVYEVSRMQQKHCRVECVKARFSTKIVLLNPSWCLLFKREWVAQANSHLLTLRTKTCGYFTSKCYKHVALYSCFKGYVNTCRSAVSYVSITKTQRYVSSNAFLQRKTNITFWERQMMRDCTLPPPHFHYAVGFICKRWLSI
jgi:hypothetical protein